MNSGGSTRECLVFGIVNRRGMTIPIYDLSACEANNLELSNFKLHPRAGPSDRKSTQLPETGNQNTTTIWNCSSRVPCVRSVKIAGYYSRLTTHVPIAIGRRFPIPVAPARPETYPETRNREPANSALEYGRVTLSPALVVTDSVAWTISTSFSGD